MFATKQEILLDDIRTKSGTTLDRQTANAGFVQIKGSTGHTADPGTYFAVQFVTECTMTAFVVTNSIVITDGVYPAGLVIYGDITAITCAAADNVYILYKK